MFISFSPFSDNQGKSRKRSHDYQYVHTRWLILICDRDFQASNVHFNFTPTQAANDMMMILTGDLIGEMTIMGVRRTYQTVFSQEFKSAVDSRFGETWKFFLRLFI